MNILKSLYQTADYKDKFGMVFNTNCIEFMSAINMGGGI